ncbi:MULTISPECIES: response regulator transcription factor [Pseudomonas]|uniref:response regulator transcription factor n=1 Tax=Pseudomonas TaxID=286 RepID=UPI000CFAE685|nr:MULTISPECIES: response regulator transcription factor [Pseudomonas]PQZ89368.1 DNA-binding response regulator [Pseudomonas trivialis]PRB25090.1 DNA-binding response regulator [Pseudomonas sp. MYb60]
MHSALQPRAGARILAIEDDPVLAANLDSHLLQRGFCVTLRHDGQDLQNLLRDEAFDLILMDIMLPGGNGLELLAQLRKRQRTPVILMSALGAEQDRISGFSQGADDYLPKPFSLMEMDVRIDAILRRVAYEHASQAPVNPDPQLLFDEQRADVSRNDAWANLTSTEYRVLQTLVQHPAEVLTKAFLYQQVMHRAYSQHDRSLDMHVSRVRRKLQAIGYTGGRIETVRGMGYLLTPLQS